MRAIIATLAGLTLAALTLAGLSPVVQVHPGSIIVNTRVSSAVIDRQGVAYAIGSLTTGIDLTHGIDVYAEWANCSACGTPVGLIPIGQPSV